MLREKPPILQSVVFMLRDDPRQRQENMIYGLADSTIEMKRLDPNSSNRTAGLDGETNEAKPEQNATDDIACHHFLIAPMLIQRRSCRSKLP